MARSHSRSRSRGRREKRSRSRARRADRSRSRDAPKRAAKRSRSRSRERRPARRSRSASERKPAPKPRKPEPVVAEASRSKSRRPKRRSRTPERVPPTSFGDYEPSPDGSGWYIYKKMAKWKYHPETGLYLHIKSSVYYIQKDGDAKAFRKIEDEDDPMIRKMKQSEEMRKAIQSTEFVSFDAQAAPDDDDEDGVPIRPAQPGPPPMPNLDKGDQVGVPMPQAQPQQRREDPNAGGEPKIEGKVREWNSEKGFGFIVPLAHEDEAAKSIFVHLWNVTGSTHANPINLREGARVQYKLGEQDGKPRATDVVMLGKDGRPLPVHAGAQTLEEKRKSYYVTAESLGVRVHAESWPGKQIELRDRYTSDEPMDELGVYFGAFDGHGGAQVSEMASKQLHKNILAHFRQKQVQPASRDEKLRQAVKEAFMQTDKEILALSERKKFDSVGSTALVALLHGNPKLGTALRLVLAHVGDSRAVLCRGGQAVAVSEDHKPDRLDEKKRIERAGGLVLNVRGAWRIAAPTNPRGSSKASRREYQGLAMTRSLGDACFKIPTALSSPEPEVKIWPITDKDSFLVLATDGIYNVLSNQEVVDCAARHWNDPEEAGKNIVRTAFQKGSDENLTALVIQFGWADKHTPKFIEKRKAQAAKGVFGGSPTLKPTTEAKSLETGKDSVDDFDMFG